MDICRLKSILILSGILFFPCISFHLPSHAGEIYLHTVYDDGFSLKSKAPDGPELKIGGLFQADYRYYSEEQRADNRFDIRRSRLIFSGKQSHWLNFRMEYEFQGKESDNLNTAYGEINFGRQSVRMGQFKEPFSLEWQSTNRTLFFAERSTAYSLSPKRDMGLMISGCFFRDKILYSAGLFNGDGTDGSSAGNEHDEPEVAVRTVVIPFKASSTRWLSSFQTGFSGTYAKIDTLNVNLNVKSPGMAGTQHSIYELTHNTKFGVLQNVEDRIRMGLETAWSYGPLAIQGELVKLTYRGLEPAGSPSEDADFISWYAGASLCLTGEKPFYSGGVPAEITPQTNFDPKNGGTGALCLAVRLDHFTGDKDWINPASSVSVEESDGISLALTWILNPFSSIIFDFSHTEFSDDVRVRVLPDGGIDYIDKENVLTSRFQLHF